MGEVSLESSLADPPPLKKTKATKLIRSQLFIGLILLLLGAGNILFAQHKADYYQEHIQSTLLQQTTPTKSTHESFHLPQPSATSDEHIEHLRARHSFYRFCILGGKILLCFSGVFFLSALVLLKSTKVSIDSHSSS